MLIQLSFGKFNQLSFLKLPSLKQLPYSTLYTHINRYRAWLADRNSQNKSKVNWPPIQDVKTRQFQAEIQLSTGDSAIPADLVLIQCDLMWFMKFYDFLQVTGTWNKRNGCIWNNILTQYALKFSKLQAWRYCTVHCLYAWEQYACTETYRDCSLAYSPPLKLKIVQNCQRNIIYIWVYLCIWVLFSAYACREPAFPPPSWHIFKTKKLFMFPCSSSAFEGSVASICYTQFTECHLGTFHLLPHPYWRFRHTTHSYFSYYIAYKYVISDASDTSIYTQQPSRIHRYTNFGHITVYSKTTSTPFSQQFTALYYGS